MKCQLFSRVESEKTIRKWIAGSRDPASGEWKETGAVVDRPASMTAVTGRETRCEQGKAAVFACEQMDLLGFLPTSALGAKRGIMLNDIWGWTDEASGREFALALVVEHTVATHEYLLSSMALEPRLRELASRLKFPAFVRPDGTRKFRDYPDFIINYETDPGSGIGFLSGWRGKARRAREPTISK